MSWRPGARGGATQYVCDYLISWFMLIVWFHQSLKWCKLVCSLQILSVSRRVIRMEAWTMMTPRPGTGSGWRCATSSGYWHHHQVIAMGGYSALIVMVPQWYCIHLCCKTIHRFHNRFSQSRRMPLPGPSDGWNDLLAFTFKTLLRHYAKQALTQ